MHKFILDYNSMYKKKCFDIPVPKKNHKKDNLKEQCEIQINCYNYIENKRLKFVHNIQLTITKY
jgi:hypothetical protein